MTQTVATQLAALTAIVNRIDLRAEEDRADRRTERMQLENGLAQDRANAETSRLAVHNDLLQIRRAQEDLAGRLAAVEPVTKMVTSLQAKMTGGLLVLGVIGAVLWGGILFFKESVIRFVYGS